MDIRSLWMPADIPAHSTTDEKITVLQDSMSISELFERAARGESLEGFYDENEEDSYFDMSHDPDMQDPLLRESLQLEKNEDVKQQAITLSRSRKTSSRQGRVVTNNEDTPLDKQVSSEPRLSESAEKDKEND